MPADVAAVVASATSACCVVGATRSRRARVAALLMLAAMVGCAVAEWDPALRPVSFVLGLASVPFALSRAGGRVHPMSVHRALGGVLMAALAMTTGAMAMATAGGGMDAGGHAHAHGIPLQGMLWAFLAGYLVFSGWLVAVVLHGGRAPCRADRIRRILRVGEVAGMGVGVLLMAMM